MGVEYSAEVHDCFRVETYEGKLPNDILSALSKRGFYLSIGTQEMKNYHAKGFLYYGGDLDKIMEILRTEFEIETLFFAECPLICGDIED